MKLNQSKHQLVGVVRPEGQGEVCCCTQGLAMPEQSRLRLACLDSMLHYKSLSFDMHGSSPCGRVT